MELSPTPTTVTIKLPHGGIKAVTDATGLNYADVNRATCDYKEGSPPSLRAIKILATATDTEPSLWSDGPQEERVAALKRLIFKN